MGRNKRKTPSKKSSFPNIVEEEDSNENKKENFLDKRVPPLPIRNDEMFDRLTIDIKSMTCYYVIPKMGKRKEWVEKLELNQEMANKIIDYGWSVSRELDHRTHLLNQKNAVISAFSTIQDEIKSERKKIAKQDKEIAKLRKIVTDLEELNKREKEVYIRLKIKWEILMAERRREVD
jgi:polyhydroxyalkanoate synthesis regulator phasin